MTIIRPMQTSDLDEVVETHLASFQGFFLSLLGKSFLRELYAGILSVSIGIAFVAEKKGHVQGFVAGTDRPREFYKRLLRQHWLRFAWASVGPAIRKPKSIPRLLRAFSRGQQGDVRKDCATLMSIAVSPDAQGNGLGTLLLQAFLDSAANRGMKKVNLITDRNDNESANLFYQKMGFHLCASFSTSERREMNEYLMELPAR